MILVCGGIKGGVGKTTLATNMAILFAHAGKDVLLVDADDQETASDFTIIRNETLADLGGAGYTAIKLHGAAVRSEGLRLAPKYDHIVIDVGGRDTAGQRAALSIADVYAIPFLPASFDVWTLEKVASLIEEARPFNDKLKTLCFLNRADARGQDNDEATEIAREIPQLTYIDAPLGNRKAFRAAASKGLSVIELRPEDPKASGELTSLFDRLTNITVASKRHQAELTKRS
ncbi:MAG: AAA family ATPase [Candidatus Obscuribacterales bacterium]|nr:AAA family ATPase [Candidatus Obscuribacterales bacterium]